MISFLYTDMLSATDFVENNSTKRNTVFYSAVQKKKKSIFRFCQKPKPVFRSLQRLALWMTLPVSFVLATCLSQQTLVCEHDQNHRQLSNTKNM